MSSAMRHHSQVHAGWVNPSTQQLTLSTSTSRSSSSSAAVSASSNHPGSISSSNHSSSAPAIKKQRPLLSVVPVPRSSSLAGLMGQNQARPTPPPLPEAMSPLTAKGISLSNAAAATGHKLKRALAGHRKRSDAVDSSPSTSVEDRQDNDAPLRSPLSAKQLVSHLHIFGNKRLAKRPQSPLPPPLPPKPAGLTKKSSSFSSQSTQQPSNDRSSIMVLSPNISPAVGFLRRIEDEKSVRGAATSVQSDEKGNIREDSSSSRDDWRKSDSTMTAKPGSHRTSRPVSMAESLQSNHTVVPNARRLSAFLTETEGMVAEVDSSESQPDQVPFSSASASTTPQFSSSSAVKAQNRRSLTLNRLPSPSLYLDTEYASPATMLTSETVTRSPSASTDSTTLMRAAANGFITPSNSVNQSSGKNARDRLAAWTGASHAASLPRQPRALSTPDTGPRRHSPSLRSTVLSQPRQPTTSFTSSFAPAAGLAKRAVERMGRALGGITSSSSSVYSSTSTASSPTSQASSYTSEHPLSRHDSRQSTAAVVEKSTRKTPNAPSGSWSIVSSVVSSSAADLDAFLTPDGPYLGKQLRAPLRLTNGGAGVAGGLVFGRDLKTCCRETAIRASRNSELSIAQSRNMTGPASVEEIVRALETRVIPAIVVRCAQHLLLWGVHEEGLFRVNGRPFHVSKLRSEFDTGSDYDMSECGPAELDPHAVASVFKAYLRELPEPILTRYLLSQFDAAITAEGNTADRNQKGPILGRGIKGPSLPSAPRNGLMMMRKPPSLSTLSLPNFSTNRPPSRTLVKALRSLILQLPEENRDLIRTVTDLIKTTAKHSKETKMPLSNLLLVFCPSLNMNPPLLRALCECDGIWEDEPNSPLAEEDVDGAGADHSIPRSGVAGLASPATEIAPSRQRDRDAMTTRAPVPVVEHSTLRAKVIERNVPIPTIYLDAESCASSIDVAPRPSSKDDVSCISTQEEPVKNSSPVSVEGAHSDLPPPLSPSTDSLATPSTSSFSDLPIHTDPYSKPQTTSLPGSPVIAESTNLPLPPRKPAISSPVAGPVQFPLTGPIPQPPSPNTRRRSVPHLSLPTFSIQSEDSTPESPSTNRAGRLKKPSLNLLFVKAAASVPSATSLISFSPYLHGWSASSSSSSTPTSAVTAQSSHSMTNLAPVLDTSIDSSPLGLDLPGASEEEERQDTVKAKTTFSRRPSSSGDTRTSRSPAQSLTPIADLYRTPSVSMHSLHSSSADAPPSVLRTQQQEHLHPRRPAISFESTSSNNRLGGPPVDVGDGDWTRSVLLAADMD